MKILVLSVTILNFVTCFPYNGNQETHSQTNYLSAKPPLSASESHRANQLSSILRAKNNSAPTDDSNSYSESTDTVTRHSGSLSERNHSETLQASMYNFPPFGNDVPSNPSANQTSASFAYVEGPEDNSTQAESPMSNVSPSSAAMQDTSAVSIIISRFVPNSAITRRMMAVSEENSISAPVSITTHQYKSDSIAIPHYQGNTKATQSLEPFLLSTGRSKPFFAPNHAAYIQNTKNEFSASADERNTAISNSNNLLGTYTTTGEEEARLENIFFTDTTTLMKEGNTATIDATDILEDYTTLLDVPDMEDENVIISDTTYLERYGKTMSNSPDAPQKDNSVVINATDKKNHHRTTVNTQMRSVSSAKNTNDFESYPILRTYNKADIKSSMTTTDADEATSNINPINTKNSFLNYRMYKKNNNAISNFNDTKTMLDVAKNTMHAGDLTFSKTNGITSTKHYANPNSIAPTTNINFKTARPSKENTIIDGRHTVQMENSMTPNNNNIAKATGSKLDDPVIEFHSNIPASVHLKLDRNYFKSVSNDEIEEVIPVVQQTTNMDQDDAVTTEVIFLHPDISTREIRRKIYSLNPGADYGQIARNKIILLPDIPDMFNSLFKNKIRLFTIDSKNLIKNRGDHRTPTTISANNTRAKMDVERTSVLKTANFQSNITPIITPPGTVGTVYFSEDRVADMTTTSASKLSFTPSDKSTDSVDETISLSTNNNNASGGTGPNPETDFPINKGDTFLSVAESSILRPKAQNNQDQNSLLTKHDSLTDAWISDSVAKNSHLTNDAIIRKWKINKVSVDPLNIPLESTFLTADFTFPTDEFSTGKGPTDMTDKSKLMINKATIPEGRSTVALNSLPAKTAGIHTQKQRFRSLIDKERLNEEELTPYMEVKSAVGEDGIFQIEDLLPEHNSKYSESGSSDFERNGFVAVHSTKPLSKLSSNILTTEVTVSDRDLTTPEEENVDVLYVTKPANGKTHFKTIVTKATVNGLSKSASVKQNVEAAEGPEFLPRSNSIPQSGKDHRILSNLYYSVITDNPLTINKENPNVARNTMQYKPLLFAMDNADLTDYTDDSQTPAATPSSNAKRLINKGKRAGTEITTIPLGHPTLVDDISNEDKNTDAVTDLASIALISPLRKGILTMNEANTRNNKLKKLGTDFTMSRGDPKVSTDDGTLLAAYSSAFMPSVDPYSHPQATNPIKKISLADIIIPKNFQNKSTPAALTVAVTATSQGDADTMLYSAQYESKHPFKENITVNSEAYPQKDIGIIAKEEGGLEENVRDNVYVTPIAGDNVPKDNNLTAKHSLHSGVYHSTRSKGTTKTTADQLEFENPASFYKTEVSKPLLRKFAPEFQRKVIVRNSNSDAEHDTSFGGDSLYPMMKENVPKGYIFSPERRSTFITSDFRIPMKDNTNPVLEGTVLLGKGISHTNYASYTDEQSDPGTEKDQTGTDSTKNSHTGIIPVTFSIPIPSEDTNVKNYYHISGTGTPVSLGYANTLRDDSSILRPETTLAKENNLDAMDLIIIEPDKSDSEYISNKHSLELEKEKKSFIQKSISFIHRPNGLEFHTTYPKAVASKSLLYRITHPEFETKEKYQTIILKEENSDSDIVATFFKDYTKNFNTQHLENMAPSLMDATETFSSEFLERSSMQEETISEDEAVIILPEISDLGNKKIQYFSVPYTETTVTMGESSTFGTVPTDHAEIITSIKSQGHPYRKGISSTVGNPIAPELADTIKSEKSKVNENKLDLAEMMPSQDHMHLLAQDIASQAKNISYVSEVTKGIIKKDSISSLNPVSATKIPTNVTIISPNAPTFDSKESNKNGNSTLSEINDVRSIKLKYLLIPNQKKTRITDALSQNDDSLSDKSVDLELLGEHSIITDQNREVTKVQSNPQLFSMVSSVPLEDPTTFSENPINVATGIPTTENGGIYDKTGTMAIAPKTVFQPTIHKKEQINKSSDQDVNHHINKAVINPSAKEITASGTGTNAFFGKDKAILEDESYNSDAQIPVILKEVNSVNISPFILKPYVASAEHKVPRTLKETFYPDFTMSTAKLRKAKAEGSFPLGNDNLKKSVTNSNNKSYPPVKPTLPPTGSVDDNYEFDLALVAGESNIKMTDESIIARDIIVLPDKEIISPDNIIFIDDIKNIINGKRHVNSMESDNAAQYEVIPFTKDFSIESDVVFLEDENNPNDINLMTTGLDGNTFNYVSEKNSFYVGEKGKSLTTKTSPSVQGLHGYGSHDPFPTVHVPEGLPNENPVEPKTKQKYQMLISRKGNPDSDKDRTFLKDYVAKFKSKSPTTMNYLPTDGNSKISPKFPDDLSLEKDTLNGNDIIITLPEGKWIEHINAPDPESTETMGESKTFPDEIIDLTVSTTPITSKGQLSRGYVTFTTLSYQREPEMSPKSEYNQNKHLKTENYNSQNATVPSTTFNVSLNNNELPFVDKNSGNKNNRASISSSPMRTTHTVGDTTALSLENSYEGGDSMQPDENNDRPKELPSLLTSESIVLMPKVLANDSVLMSGNSLTDPSKSVVVASETGIEHLDFIHGSDISENQDIKIQTDFQPYLLDSNIPSNDSGIFTRNSTDDEADSALPVERETVNISEVKTDVQPWSTMMRVVLPREISPFSSEIKKMVGLPSKEDTAAKFDLNHITNFIPTLEKTLPSVFEPNALSKTNNKEDKHNISEAGNFVSGDSRTLKDNPFFSKFNIFATPQAPPNTKRILSIDSTMSPVKTLKPKYKNSSPPEEDADIAGLLQNVPTGSDVPLWKSILSPNYTMSVSLPKYSELHPVVKINEDTTTNTYNNTPFEERSTPSYKAIISPSTNTSTKGMVNTIFNKRFQIITEYEIVPITENISDITLDGENISNTEGVISTVPNDTTLEYATNMYVLEPKEEKYNPIIKKTTLVYDPQILRSHQFYSSGDASEHLSRGAPTEIKPREILQNLVSREEHTSSDLDAIVLKSSTDNSNSQAPRSVTHPPTHTSESIHEFLGKTTLKRDTLQGDDTIISPKDKIMEYTLVPDPEITATMVEGRIFPDEPMHLTVTTSPLKTKNQFFRKVISPAIYNTDVQGKADNILSSQADTVKGKTNMTEVQLSMDGIIPLAEFNVIPKDKLSFTNEDTEILNKRTSVSSLPMNTVNHVDETTTPSTESSYERGDSLLPEDNIRSRGFLLLQTQEKAMFTPNVSTENPEISDPVTNTSLANSSILLSNTLKTIIEYPNSINDGHSPNKNKTDLRQYSKSSTKLPIGSTIFSDNSTNNEFYSLSSVNRETTDGSKTKTDKIHSEPQRTIMKAFSPTKVSQHKVPEERKIANFSDQEALAAKYDLSHIPNATNLRNATILNSAMKKIFPSVTELTTLSKSDNNVEEEVHISKPGNFFPKDASTLRDNFFTAKFDATSTKPQAPPKLKGIFSAGSTLTLPEASRSNYQSSSEDATGERTITNTPIGTYGLSPWKPTLPSDFTTSVSLSEYSELDPGIKMKKDTTTKTNNNILPGERYSPYDKTISSLRIILSKKGMKNPMNTINNNKFGDKIFIGKDISTEVVPFTEYISEKAQDTLLAGENIPNDEDIVTIIPVDSALDYVADNYVFELVRERNGALTSKTTLSNDYNVLESLSPHASAAVSEHASQGSPIDIKTTKKHQSFIPKDKNLNSDAAATALKSSSVNFNSQATRSMIYSLTDSRWIFSPEFPGETVVENSSQISDSTTIILPKGERMEYSFVPDPELMIRTGERKTLTTDSINPAGITHLTEFKDQFNRKGISFAFYNNDTPNEAKPTISAILNANKHKPNLADMPHSQNNITPLAKFNVIPDDDLPFIGKNTEKANNRASLFSSSMDKAASTVADSIVLSTEGSYEGGDSTLPGEDVKSRGFSSLLTSAMVIPNSLPENPETSGLITDQFLSESVINRSEMLQRAIENVDVINGGDILERQVISQADIHSYPLAQNISPTGSITSSGSNTDGEVDSFFSLNRDTPKNYKTKTDKIHFKSQRAMMKALSLREESQDSVYERRKMANLIDQKNPAAKLELHNFTKTTVFIPAMRKILPSGTEPNPLSKSNSNKEDSFTVKFNATSFEPQTPPNLKGIFLADSTLTLPEDVRHTSHDKVTNTGGSIMNTPTRLHGLRWRSTFPPSDFTTSMGNSKYSELVPVTNMGKDMTKKTDYNIPHEKIIIPSDKGIISPIITSEKDMASTLQGSISEHKDLPKRGMAAEYGIIYFPEDISEWVDDISSEGKITPVYMDHTTIMSDDSGSEYISDIHAFKSEDRANNSLTKMGTLMYVPKTHMSYAPYTTVAASNSLSKTVSPVFEAKENYQAIIPKQENSIDTNAIALKNSNANVNTKTHRPTTHFLTDKSIKFPSSFSNKTPAGKSNINGNDDTVIPSNGFDSENKITEYYSLSPEVKPVIDSKTFTTDTTNLAFENTGNFLRRTISPTIHKTFTLKRADTTTSSLSDFTEDQTGIATVSGSRFSNFPLVRLSSDDLSNVKENKGGGTNTVLTFFYPLKKMSASRSNVPVISTKNKNNIGHYSLPSSESIRSLRLAPMGLPEILILTSKDSAKETAASKLIKGTNVYYPTLLISAASEPVSTDLPYFNKGIASERQNTKSQIDPKAFPLVYTVLQADSTGSSDNMANAESNTSASIVTKSKIFDIDAFGDQHSEPKKTTIKFSPLFPNEYSKPNFYYTTEITKASAMKDTAEVNHLIDVSRATGNDPVIQVETNSLKDANLKPYLVNKNIIDDNKSGNKDDDIVPVAAYSSLHKSKNSLPDGSVPQETYFTTRNSNLLTEVITIIPTERKSLSDTEIIPMVEENSWLEFN